MPWHQHAGNHREVLAAAATASVQSRISQLTCALESHASYDFLGDEVAFGDRIFERICDPAGQYASFGCYILCEQSRAGPQTIAEAD
jgi:hypothetical protein